MGFLHEINVETVHYAALVRCIDISTFYVQYILRVYITKKVQYNYEKDKIWKQGNFVIFWKFNEIYTYKRLVSKNRHISLVEHMAKFRVKQRSCWTSLPDVQE